MSIDVLERSLDLLDPAPGERPRVCFTGGEPLLELDLIWRAVGLLEQRFGRGACVFRLLSNGTLLDEDALEYLDAARFQLQVSLDGGAFAQELRAPGTWQEIQGLFHRMARRHPRMLRERVSTAMVVTAANVGHLAESVASQIHLGVRTIRAGPVTTDDPGWHRGLEVVLERQLLQIAGLCRPFVQRGEPAPFAPLRRFRESDRRRDPGGPLCAVADPESLAVGPDGVIAGCTALLNLGADSQRSFVEQRVAPLHRLTVFDMDGVESVSQYLGELAATGFPGSNRQRYSSRRRCAACEHLGVCRICPMAAGQIPGNADPHRVPDLACAYVDAVLRTRDTMPATPSIADRLRGAGELPAERRAVERRMSAPGPGLTT